MRYAGSLIVHSISRCSRPRGGAHDDEACLNPRRLLQTRSARRYITANALLSALQLKLQGLHFDYYEHSPVIEESCWRLVAIEWQVAIIGMRPPNYY